MGNISKSFRKSRNIIAACVLLLPIATAIVFMMQAETSDEIKTEDVNVSTVDIEETLTAAGEVVTADDEQISFSTSKIYSGMCVEENETVVSGQHLIAYSDGTYTDAEEDGIVTAINAPETGTAATSTNYLTIAYTDVLELEITVPESEINAVSEGNTATVIVNSDTSNAYEAEIKRKKAVSTTLLSSVSSESSGDNDLSSQGGSRSTAGSQAGSAFGSDSSAAYYTVVLKFHNDGTIKPGMSAICTLVLSKHTDVMAVPIEAVKFNEDQPYVQVVSGNEAKDTDVTLGISDANYVEITEGLDGSETIRIEKQGEKD